MADASPTTVAEAALWRSPLSAPHIARNAPFKSKCVQRHDTALTSPKEHDYRHGTTHAFLQHAKHYWWACYQLAQHLIRGQRPNAMDSETFCLAYATCVLRIWAWHDHTAAAVAGAVAAGHRMLQKMATSSCTGAESFEATISSSIAMAANEALALTAAANHLAERAGSFRHHLAHACIYMHVRPQARQLRARTPRTLALWKREVGAAAGDTGSKGAKATRERLVSTHGAPQEQSCARALRGPLRSGSARGRRRRRRYGIKRSASNTRTVGEHARCTTGRARERTVQ
jgi:hypothetical protein